MAQQWWETAPVVAEKPAGVERPAVEFQRQAAPMSPAEEVRLGFEAERLRIAKEEEGRKQKDFEAKQAKVQKDIPSLRAELKNVIEKARRAKELSSEWFATGFGAERAAGIGGTAAADVAALLDTIGASTAFDRLQRMRDESPTGGALGNVTERELDLLKSTIASLRQSQSDKQFRRSMDDVISAYERTLARLPSEENELTPEPDGSTEAPETTRPAVVGAIQGDQPIVTAQDREAQQAMQAAWDRSGNADDVIAVAAQYGRTLRPQDIEFLRANAGQPVNIQANPTGQPTAAQQVAGEVMATPAGEAVGGYAMGAANALTAGMLDELAPVLGLDPARVQAGKEYLRQRAPVSSFAGEVTGGVMGAIPAIRGAGAALAGSRLAGAAPLLGETAYGAAYGAGEAAPDQRLVGALLGGGAAGAGGALANRLLPGGPGTFSGIAPQAPTSGSFAGGAAAPQQVIEAGQQAGIPVMTSDVMPPETFMGRIGQQVGEIVPLGTAGQRRAQQESREQAVESLLADAGVTVDRDIASDLVRNLNEKRSSDLRKFTDMKRQVIAKYSSGGDVPAPKSLQAIDDLIVKLEDENLPRQLGGLTQQLRDVRNSLSGPGNLTKIENNRATIFDLKGDPGLANISSKSEKAFREVYKALNDDMGDFIKANGNIPDFNRWKVANTKLAMMAGELKQSGLKRVLEKGEFDPSTVTKMLTSNNPNETRLLFTNLGKQGRENARLLLLQNAATKALNRDTGTINPSTFAREVGKMKSGFSQFFGGAEAKRVKGLVDVLNATKRAQESQFVPRTGERLVPFATAGSFGWLGTLLGFDATTGLASSAAFGAARRLYESPQSRDMLLKIANATGSEKARLISNYVQRITAAGAAVGATDAASEGQQPVATITATEANQ
jgi:hypothetical protein